MDPRAPLESSNGPDYTYLFIRLLFIINCRAVRVDSLRHNIFIKLKGLKVKMKNSNISKFDLRSLQRDNDSLPSLADLQSGKKLYSVF